MIHQSFGNIGYCGTSLEIHKQYLTGTLAHAQFYIS